MDNADVLALREHVQAGRLAGTAGTHQGRERSGLDITVDVMKQASGAAWNWDGVVEPLPGERLAIRPSHLPGHDVNGTFLFDPLDSLGRRSAQVRLFLRRVPVGLTLLLHSVQLLLLLAGSRIDARGDRDTVALQACQKRRNRSREPLTGK